MQHTARSGLLSILSKLGDDLERASDFHRHRLWERWRLTCQSSDA